MQTNILTCYDFISKELAVDLDIKVVKLNIKVYENLDLIKL